MPENILSLGLQTVPEINNPFKLPVEGKIPLYLSSKTLYRVGPGLYDVTHSDGKPFKISHWFDGLSILHAFDIDAASQTVHYHSRSLVDDLSSAIEQVPSTSWNEISFGGVDPCRSTLGRLFQILVPSKLPPHRPNIGVTVQNIPRKGLTVRSDFPENYSINEQTLEIEEHFGFSSLNDHLQGNMSAAHGQYDANTKEFFNYTYALGPGQVTYKVFKVSSAGDVNVLAEFKHEPVYIHSFAMTENYVILITWPLHVNALKVLWTRSIAKSWTFHKDLEATFFVVSRHGDGLVKTHKSKSFFCFHTINAFEKDGNIFIDLSRYDDTQLVDELYLDSLRTLKKFSASTLTRFKLTADGNTVESIVNQHDIELSTINPGFSMKEYKFTYGVSSEVNPFDTVAKVDVKSGERVIWSNPMLVVGEPIFVPDPQGCKEDDGCVLVVVLDSLSKTSSMVVLAAESLCEVARARVPQIVPLGFHGAVSEQVPN